MYTTGKPLCFVAEPAAESTLVGWEVVGWEAVGWVAGAKAAVGRVVGASLHAVSAVSCKQAPAAARRARVEAHQSHWAELPGLQEEPEA